VSSLIGGKDRREEERRQKMGRKVRLRGHGRI
jgi:hypothetical protein